MVNPVPDRGGPERSVAPKKLYGKEFDQYNGHKSAYDMAKAHESTMYSHPAYAPHRVWSLWASHPEGVEETSQLHIGQFDRVLPHDDKKTGERGVLATKGISHQFFPNSAISAIHNAPRKGAPPERQQAEAWNSRLPHTATAADVAPGSR